MIRARIAECQPHPVNLGGVIGVDHLQLRRLADAGAGFRRDRHGRRMVTHAVEGERHRQAAAHAAVPHVRRARVAEIEQQHAPDWRRGVIFAYRNRRLAVERAQLADQGEEARQAGEITAQPIGVEDG
ncbi:MAG: hypothetical protein IPO91_07775 [Chloroflexi bacterium]|nr:hypothetical protein [Chloroflexota bacterium]